MSENKRFDWDVTGIWDFQSDSDEYLESHKEICELLNELNDECIELREAMKRMMMDMMGGR